MPDSLLSVSDLVADAFNLSGQEISNLANAAPVMAMLPYEAASDGTTHKYITYTTEPTVDFRAENDGREHSESVDAVVTVTLKILDFSWKVDKAVADAWRQGGAEALIAREGARHLAAAMFKAERQLIRGTNASASGFNGWENNAACNQLADTMVVNGTGTTASTQTSVWLIRASECNPIVRPMDGIELGETIVVPVAGATGTFPAYYTPASVWLGAKIGGAYSMARIVNIHPTDSGAQLDDDKISSAIAKFPAGRGPTHIVMNRQSLKMLQQSRTATNPTGSPAPFPTESFGIPIIVTDAIVSTESVVA